MFSILSQRLKKREPETDKSFIFLSPLTTQFLSFMLTIGQIVKETYKTSSSYNITQKNKTKVS